MAAWGPRFPVAGPVLIPAISPGESRSPRLSGRTRLFPACLRLLFSQFLPFFAEISKAAMRVSLLFTTICKCAYRSMQNISDREKQKEWCGHFALSFRGRDRRERSPESITTARAVGINAVA
jgi:hypothetical protein